MKKIEGHTSNPPPYQLTQNPQLLYQGDIQQNSIDVQPVLPSRQSPQTNQLRKEKKTGNMPIKSSKKD